MFNMGAIGAPEMAKSIFYVHPIQIDLSITIYLLWKSNWPHYIQNVYDPKPNMI